MFSKFDEVADNLDKFLNDNAHSMETLGEHFLTVMGPDNPIVGITLDQWHEHEVLDRVDVLSAQFETVIREHPLVALTPQLASTCVIISMLLNRLYQDVGNASTISSERLKKG